MTRSVMCWAKALLLACSALGCERTPVASSTPVAVSATTAPLASAPTPRGEPTAGLPPALGNPSSTGMGANTDPPVQLETRLIQDLKAGERRPLVLFLHGLGSSGKLSFETTPLAELGARDRVHVIAADGTLDSAGRRFWNAGKACCNFEDKPIDDVARLGALLDTWSQRPDVDPARVYVAGYSNGGFMAHRLACERGDRLAAVVALAAGVEAGSCPKQPRLSVLMVNGDADSVVRYGGGQVLQKPGLASFLPAVEGLREWGKRLGCSKETARRAIDVEPQLPGPETASLGFEKCDFGGAELLSIHGGTHHLGSRRGVVEAAWKFLLSHRKR
jgi:polyhydroxybutyrate depolymerase